MPTKHHFQFGPFRLDPKTRVLLRDGDVVPLPPKAVDTLLALLQSAGQPVDKESLIQAVWPETIVEENNLTHHISVLRKTLGNGESGRAYIETIPKRGYRFVGAVEETVENDGAMQQAPGAPARYRVSRRSLVVAVIALPLGGASVYSWWLSRRGSDTPTYESMAVLPFQNLSGDPNQNYVSDGLTESLIAELGRLKSLRVISRSSVMRYKDSRKPLPEIARELNAGAIIEGSIARFGDRARVTVQLVDGGKDKHLWAETYERDLAEIPKLWGEVAIAVAREVRALVEPEHHGRLHRASVQRAAFEYYLRGRYYWNKRTPENIHTAIGLFRKAIDQDPAYARAYAGLADCYNQLGTVLIGGQPAQDKSARWRLPRPEGRSRSIRNWPKPMPLWRTRGSTTGSGLRRSRDFGEH